MTAKDIVGFLEHKHCDDLFVPECKTGQSQNPRIKMHKFDAWVMRKSYSKYGYTGYEIKVDRSDFLGDKKWPAYLDYCNEFYFVCPAKLIQPSEVADGVGLMWAHGRSGRLVTKVKARPREISFPETLIDYILISRTNIKGQPDEVAREQGVTWRKKEALRWLAQKKEDREIGWEIGKSLKKIVDERITLVHHENNRVKEENKKLEDIKLVCERVGFDIDRSRWDTEARFERAVNSFQNGSGLISSFDDAIKALGDQRRILVDAIELHKKKGTRKKKVATSRRNGPTRTRKTKSVR